MRQLRELLDEKPRSPDASRGLTYPVRIRSDTVYVTKAESDSFKRQSHLAFLLIGIGMASLLINFLNGVIRNLSGH
jgi:hypothetical protein